MSLDFVAVEVVEVPAWSVGPGVALAVAPPWPGSLLVSRPMVSTCAVPDGVGVPPTVVDDPAVEVFVGVGVPFCVAPDMRESSDVLRSSTIRAETMLGLT